MAPVKIWWLTLPVICLQLTLYVNHRWPGISTPTLTRHSVAQEPLSGRLSLSLIGKKAHIWMYTVTWNSCLWMTQIISVHISLVTVNSTIRNKYKHRREIHTILWWWKKILQRTLVTMMMLKMLINIDHSQYLNKHKCKIEISLYIDHIRKC
jgi:hypothetical protein